MKSILLGVFLHVAICSVSFAQINGAEQKLEQQAMKMGSALLSGDYVTFSHYTYPLILKAMGGEKKMAEVLLKSTEEMKSQGISFDSISLDKCSQILKSGKELQGTIVQHTLIKTPKGNVISTSTLIAVSTDNGNNWTFIDTSNKDMATLKQILPNLNPAIVITQHKPELRSN